MRVKVDKEAEKRRAVYLDDLGDNFQSPVSDESEYLYQLESQIPYNDTTESEIVSGSSNDQEDELHEIFGSDSDESDSEETSPMSFIDQLFSDSDDEESSSMEPDFDDQISEISETDTLGRNDDTTWDSDTEGDEGDDMDTTESPESDYSMRKKMKNLTLDSF